MLDLYELQVFLIAAELENFSETARMLDISQPAVSGHIQSLEHRLNTQLFDRVGRHIRLNDAGAALVPSVRGLLKEAENLIQSVTEGKLDERGNAAGFDGDWGELVRDMNGLI